MSTSSQATLLPWHRPVFPAPKLLVLPPDVVSLDEADAAIELWEHYKRRTLDPWQRLSVQIKLATRADGRWAARTTGEEVPRQAGKGDAEEVVELWGLVQRAERILHTIHDAVLLATETHGRMLSLIDSHPDLRRKKSRAWSGTGQQMIEMRNGGIIWYRTRTGGGGRGIDEVDRVVVDEAQHAEAGQIEAVSPTQLISVNPQTNVMGTGALDGKSAWWWSVRKRAILPDPGEFAYLGFTAESLSVVDGRVVADRPDVSTVDQFLELVHEVHPAVRRRPDLIGFFAEEYRKLGPEGASREYLLMWDAEPDSDAGQVIALDEWRALIDPYSTIVTQPKIVLEVSPDRKWAAFGAAGRRSDGLMHVEQIRRDAGTGWVVAQAEEYESRYGAIHVQTGSPAHALMEPLRQAGRKVEEISKSEHAQALGQLVDLVAAKALRHPDQADVEAALSVARVKTAGDVGVWGRRSTTGDISSIVTITLALGRVAEYVKPPPQKARVRSW